MEAFSSWENLLLGVLALLIIFWMRPGIKALLEQSRKAPADWQAVLVPLGLVVLFVIFLTVVV
ncbi:hypothetical protein [Methylobacter sp. YRD-M1]|uniref:hypothetical protein n=1 Tax=Methylobacter sp. YRD-M1 TaxID=2911520 RepID=UPI00227CBCB3|nr:hypothetical protein [Methylobacter sp. YRD-M1]WAK01941.1 hypothetical protein LZ558_19320 [Methylobacter sp. YRD-M1]